MPPKTDPSQSAHDIVTLVKLFKLRAGFAFIPLTTARLGESLRISQQAASNRLTSLERAGLVQRSHKGRGFSVRLTDDGIGVLREFYGELKGEFERKVKELRFSGSVFTGFGEGAYYVSHPGYAKQFLASLGFKPFPGTLNLRLDSAEQKEQRRALRFLEGIQVGGFKEGSRTFGPVKCFRARFGSRPGAALAIERTHYDESVLELISPVNLRKSLSLKDGDECSAVVLLS